MPKNKPIYVCTDCGYESAKWMGRCPSCGAWNKMDAVSYTHLTLPTILLV